MWLSTAYGEALRQRSRKQKLGVLEKWWSSRVMGWRPKATAIFFYVYNSKKIRNVREPAKLLRIVLLKRRDTFKIFTYVSKRVLLKPCDLYVYYSSLFLCILLTFRYSDFNSSKNKYFYLKYLFYCLLRELKTWNFTLKTLAILVSWVHFDVTASVYMLVSFHLPSWFRALQHNLSSLFKYLFNFLIYVMYNRMAINY